MLNRFFRIFLVRELSVVFFLVFLFLGIGAVNPVFLTLQNIMLTLKGSVMYVLLALGMAFVIITKEIDVSIGAILGMSAAVGATLLRDGSPLVVVFAGAIIVGVVAGFVNGVGVALFRIPSIVMTLGTLGILRGLMFLYTNGKWVENLPDYFKNAAQLDIFGSVNAYVFATLLFVAAVQIYLSCAKHGKYFAAIGDNIDGAVLIGIPVLRYKIGAFVISGFCSSLAGLVYVSQVGFVGNVAGNGVEMSAIAACVLGGVSLSGGVGSVVGAACGAIIMNAINTALVFLRVPAFWNNTISGTLLILMVTADAILNKYLAEKARRNRLEARGAGL